MFSLQNQLFSAIRKYKFCFSFTSVKQYEQSFDPENDNLVRRVLRFRFRRQNFEADRRFAKAEVPVGRKSLARRDVVALLTLDVGGNGQSFVSKDLF